MNWEKVRRENLCIKHGTESAEENLAACGDRDHHTRDQHRGTITVGDPPAGMRLSGYHKGNNAAASQPTTMAIFRVLSTVYNKEALNAFTDADLKEGRRICDSLNIQLREEQFERERQNPYR